MTEIPWSFPRKAANNFPTLSVKCSGQMSVLWIQPCVFIFSMSYVMSFHNTKDNAEQILYPFLKQITMTKKKIVSFLFDRSCFPGKTILSYVLASQTQE